MGTAITKISVDCLRHVLNFPADCTIEVAPENEDGAVTLIVSHSSIPDDAAEVHTIVRREIYQHESIRFGHFVTDEEADDFVSGLNSTETPELEATADA